MKNWKTTLAGIGGALLDAWASGALETGDLKSLAASAAWIVVGYLAKDAHA